MGEYLSRNISGERRAQYGPKGVRGESLDQRADDLRRFLILKYAIHPSSREQGLKPRNLWQEEVDDLLGRIGLGSDKMGSDSGTSSGYLLELLYGAGYQGSLLAIDKEVSHFPHVHNRLKSNPSTATADIQLGGGDAENLRRVTLNSGAVISVSDDTFDFYIMNNLLHHTPQQEKALDEGVRTTKSGGLIYIMGRAVGHLSNMYEIYARAADFYNTQTPLPFYADFDIFRNTGETIILNSQPIRIRKGGDLIDNHPNLNVVKEITQADVLYIPNTDEGWQDFSSALYTHAPLMRNRNVERPIRKKELMEFVEGPVRKSWFERHASYTDDHMTELIFQKIKVCQVVK